MTRITTAICTSAGPLAANAATAEGPARLNVASTFGTNNFLGQVALELGKNVETATGGLVELEIHEPGDLVPAFEVLTPPRRGLCPRARTGSATGPTPCQ